MSVKIEVDWDDISEDAIGWLIHEQVSKTITGKTEKQIAAIVREHVAATRFHDTVAAAIDAHVRDEITRAMLKLKGSIDVGAIVREVAEDEIRRRIETVASEEIKAAIRDALNERVTVKS